MFRNRKYLAVPRPTLRPVVCAIALGLAAGGSVPVHAFEFSSADGELTGSFDTTISLGGLWRMQDREKSLISIANGGTSRDPNSDDGNLRYKKGELVSLALKATPDLQLTYPNYGAFVRASYFYDDAIMGKRGLSSAARSEAGRDAEILDAYVRGAFELGGRTLNVRAGRQVVSWGESTFIQNGINVLNPVNVTRLRVPGAELREGLTPTAMLWASQELTDNLSLELVWMAEWEKTKIEPAGTFFSTNDFVAKGGNIAYTGFGRRNDGNGAGGVFPLNATAQLYAPRSKDREPGDGGEYGISLRWFVPELNNTEFGFYHVNYHSRTPYVSGYRGGITAAATIEPGCTVFDVPTFGALVGGLGAVVAMNQACLAAATRGGAGSYFVDYPKNIKLFGLSFNTAGPAGVALQGEYSYRRNQPLQLPSADLLNAALGLANQLTSTNPTAAAGVAYGTEIKGYRRVKMHQVQLTATKALPRVLGAEQLALVGEVGYTHLQLPSSLKFAAPGCHLPQPGSAAGSSFGSTSSGCFMTRNSWGYRVVGRLDYNNLIDGATVSPRLAFSHDVNGRSPTFNEGAKALTLGLGVSYRQRWQMDVAYTSFFGGKKVKGTDPNAALDPSFPAGQSATYASHTNPLVDRDFLSVSVSYSF